MLKKRDSGTEKNQKK
ncbi:hypothetical protein CLS_24150 [[Clostridium] cf. saccharolyticum K10]|nr:hypothetical protein CLS_24150 [[Clostridium] cf. saccharolyticum K10]